MYKIFTALTFALCIIFTATAFAESNFVEVGTDEGGSKYFIETSRIKVLKREGGELIFSAHFVTVLSDEERKEVINFYRTNGADLAALDSLTNYCMQVIQFKESGGTQYLCVTDLFFFDKNKKLIKGIGFKDAEPEWEPVTAGTITETLYNAAKLYI
ncbi:MAG: hypothetical protein IJU91_04745 [Selenomonadaceae bacterium]|nr:hypothetical protein [Selenomonadaceae bacterium]